MFKVFKVGDYIRCINNVDASSFLTVGKVYIVIDNIVFPRTLSERVKVFDDYGEGHNFYKSRFVLDVSSMRRKKLKNIESRLS